MKQTKYGKVILGVILSLVVILNMKAVFAVNNFTDLTNTVGTNTTTNNTVNNTTNTTANNTTNNTTANNTSVLTTNNTSNYNNTSLPKTGIEDTFPVMTFAVILTISAIYAYKKIQYYKNI